MFAVALFSLKLLKECLLGVEYGRSFSAVSLCRSLEGDNFDNRPGFKAKESGRACFTFKMALKFKPVVVTAVLICDPLF